MTLTFVMKFAAVMILMAAADVCWTMYFVYVSSKEAVKAATWSSMIMVCGIISTIFYVEDHWLGLASIVGSYIGTYATVKWIGPYLTEKFKKE